MESFRPDRVSKAKWHSWFASHVQREVSNGLGVPKGLLNGEANYSSSRGKSTHVSVLLAIRGLREWQAALKRAAQMMAAFALAFVSPREQESAYLVHHKRLPGSLRTSRLRKKRRTRVDHWYRKFKRSKA